MQNKAIPQSIVLWGGARDREYMAALALPAVQPSWLECRYPVVGR
jgi:hypothetical protein